MCARIVMVTGGQRSGKSLLAEQITLSLSDSPVYLATARILDAGMEERVKIHRDRRGQQWTTVEAPLSPADAADLKGRTVLLDCLTMLATNHFLDSGMDVGASATAVTAQLEKLKASDADTVVIVTNEIGLGGISADEMQRKFTDLQGLVNTRLGQMADEAYISLSGIKLKLK
ncbi:MAG: bifunctional adenosylcobinamide kinase/adenosylcobinamide-phosphate guanylyltransferase [Bacteroidales bacterium]|nr:bifunctional adenosylcobinamide kinase/adenosylcobinamide-phosphate guanylyltransferase [Bacteroidales bacterium]MDE6825220.1 bifunctional adenosylcobinamide kinase/adenosylcobinamide-phosphate guanylyltransferase [Paramuribaculum sp.]